MIDDARNGTMDWYGIRWGLGQGLDKDGSWSPSKGRVLNKLEDGSQLAKTEA